MYLIYNTNTHNANTMIGDLLNHGLLIKKEIRKTKTCCYVFTKFTTSRYKGTTSRNVSSVILNNPKIWGNIFRLEYIINVVIPKMEQQNITICIESIIDYMENNFITPFYKENQMSIYNLYVLFDKIFPNAINSKPFMDDYNKCVADAYIHTQNFLSCEPKEGFEHCLQVKNEIERDKKSYTTTSSVLQNYYNLYNFVSNNFFFESRVYEEDYVLEDDTIEKRKVIEIGMFDKNLNLQLDKVYGQATLILLMLHRYFGYYPYIKLHIYSCMQEQIKAMKQREKECSYDSDYSQRTLRKEFYFQKYQLPKQYWENISVEYIYYPLIEKYTL